MADDRASFMIDLGAPGAKEELEQAARALGMFTREATDADRQAERTREKLGQFGREFQRTSRWVSESTNEHERLARALTAMQHAANTSELREYSQALEYVDRHLGEVAHQAQTAESALEALQRHASRRGQTDIAASLGGIRQWMDEVPRLAAELEKPPSRLQQAWGRAAGAVQVAVGNVMAAMAQAAARAAADFALSGAQLAIQREALEANLKSILGSEAAMAAAIVKFHQAAGEPGVSFDVAASKSLQLLQVGDNVEAATRTIIEFGNAIASAGGDERDTAEALQQYIQLLRKKKVTLEDLNPLMERSGVFASALEKTYRDFGASGIDEFQKLDVAIGEFNEHFIGHLAEEERAANLTGNAVSNLRNAWNEAKEKFGEGLLGSKAAEEVDELTGSIERLTPAFGLAGEAARTFFAFLLRQLEGAITLVEAYLHLLPRMNPLTGMAVDRNGGRGLWDLVVQSMFHPKKIRPEDVKPAQGLDGPRPDVPAPAETAPDFGTETPEERAARLKQQAEERARAAKKAADERVRKEKERLNAELAAAELARKEAEVKARQGATGISNDRVVAAATVALTDPNVEGSPGWCARYVWQSMEKAQKGLGQQFRGDAGAMARKMDEAGKRVKDGSLYAGDILFWNRGADSEDHIGIYLGDGLVAENTSDRSRGTRTQGAKRRTPLKEIGQPSAVYRVGGGGGVSLAAYDDQIARIKGQLAGLDGEAAKAKFAAEELERLQKAAEAAEKARLEAQKQRLALAQDTTQAELDKMKVTFEEGQERRRSLTEQLGLLKDIHAAEQQLLDLRYEALALTATASEAEALAKQQEADQAQLDFKHGGERQSLIELDRKRTDEALQRQVAEAKARVDLAKVAGTSDDVTRATRGLTEALREKERAAAAAGDQLEYMRVKAERLRLEQDRGKATIAEQILMAGPGSGAIAAMLRQQGITPHDLGMEQNPAMVNPGDFGSMFRKSGVRGDVVSDDAVAQAIADGIPGAVPDRVKRIAELAATKVLDSVADGLGRV